MLINFISVSALVLLGLAGGVRAQPDNTTAPEVTSIIEDFAGHYIVDGNVNLQGSDVSFVSVEYWTATSPTQMLISSWAQLEATGTNYSVYFGMCQQMNETAMNGSLAGSGLLESIYSAISSTPNGSIIDEVFSGKTADLEFDGSALFYPIAYALDQVEAIALLPAEEPLTVNRTELATLFLLSGEINGAGPFNGTIWMSDSPDQGVNDNTSIVGNEIAHVQATGQTSFITVTGRQGNESTWLFDFAGSSVGTSNWTVISKTPEGPILTGPFEIVSGDETVATGTSTVYPVKYALRIIAKSELGTSGASRRLKKLLFEV